MATFNFLALLLASFALGSEANILRSSIVGGANATQGQFPHQIALYIERNQKTKFHCGGSIISRNYVLTAAHCVDDSSNTFYILAGSTDSKKGERINVAKVIVHEDWDRLHIVNDIALLKLAQPLTYSKHVQAIELAAEPLATGSAVIISGWGRLRLENPIHPINLQWVTMEAVPSSKCDRDDDILCLLNKPGQGACMGDSGGPAINGGKLVGVCSYGVPCATGIPDGYTNVAHFLDWIKKHSDV